MNKEIKYGVGYYIIFKNLIFNGLLTADKNVNSLKFQIKARVLSSKCMSYKCLYACIYLFCVQRCVTNLHESA